MSEYKPTGPDNDGQWVTIAMAAELLKVSTKTVRRRIYDGTLPARRIGPRLIRVKLATLDQLGTEITYEGAELK